MNRHIASRSLLVLSICVASSVLGLGGGCRCDPEVETEPPIEKPDEVREPDSAFCRLLQRPPPTLCSETRRIAWVGDEACPLSDDWTVEKLGDGSLAGYCVYTAKVVGADPDAIPRKTTPDCVAIPQELDAGIHRVWHRRFEPAVDLIKAHQIADASWGRVRVAVIDTAPRQLGRGEASHGKVVASVIREVADGCFANVADESCMRRVDAYVGLPRRFDAKGGLSAPNLETGGHVGYASEVALAIKAALDEWKPAHERLIINLSLGWVPSDSADFDDPALRNLKMASCAGALIIAASGNSSPHSCESTTFLPARWETLPRPSATECKRLGVPPPKGSTTKGSTTKDQIYSPLVHSITPVTHSFGDLVTTGEASVSRLAALGFLVPTDHGSRRLTSGSSMSAAVVSGIAALVWSADTSLAADEVMQIIWKSGVTRTASVRTYLGTGEPPTQRVASACAALSDALGRELDCVRGKQNQPIASLTWDSSETKAGEQHQVDCPTCSGTSSLAVSREVPKPAGDAIVWPQPGDPPCPPCWIGDVLAPGGMASSGQAASLNLQLSADYAHLTPLGVTVMLQAAGGNREYHHYPATGLSVERPLTIWDAGLYAVGTEAPTYAWIDIHFDDRTITGNEVPVVPTQ